MDFQFLSIKDPKLITKAILTCFFQNFHITQDSLTAFSKSQLSEQLKLSELARRPKRGFQICVIIEKNNYPKPFANSDFSGWTTINKNTVLTPKSFKGGKEYPYRTLIFSNTILKRYLSPKNTQTTHTLIQELFQLTWPPAGHFEIAIPTLLFTEGYITNEGGLNKLTRPIPSLIESSIYNSHFQESEKQTNNKTQQGTDKPKIDAEKPKFSPPIPPRTTLPRPTSSLPQESLISFSSVPNLTADTPPSFETSQQGINMNNFEYKEERATKGYKTGYEFPLKGLWNPDDEQGGSSIEEVIELLKLIKEQNQYRTDQALITAFLSENKQIKLYLRLTAEEKVNLDAFTEWLRHYKEEDTLGFLHKFRTQKQNKLSFRSFALELERLYRNAKNIPQDEPLDKAGQDEITMTFRRNIRDPRIKEKITFLARTTPLKELITHCEFISSNLRDMYHHMDDPEPVTGRVQLAAQSDSLELVNSLRSDLSEMQKNFTALLLQSKNVGQIPNPIPSPRSNHQGNFFAQQNSELTCVNCNATNHTANQCDEIHRNESLAGKDFCRYCKKVNHTVRNCFKLQSKRAREESNVNSAQSKPIVPPRRNPANPSRSVAQFLSGEFNPLDVYSGNS